MPFLLIIKLYHHASGKMFLQTNEYFCFRKKKKPIHLPYKYGRILGNVLKKGRKTRETVASVIVLSMPAVLPYIISRMQYGLLMFRRCFTLYTFLILLINIVYYIHLAQREAEMKYGVEASEEKKKRLAVTVQIAVAAAFVMTAVTLFMIFTVCTMSISYLPGFARC